jgi:uncharacterized protein
MTQSNVDATAPHAAQRLKPLGIGVLYNPSLPAFLRTDLAECDFVSVIPDMFWMEDVEHGRTRYTELEAWVETLDDLEARIPIVAHSIGLSLGTASSFDAGYVEQLAAWHERYRFAWHSDHLSFVRITGPEGHDHNAGLAVPVPYDHEVLDLVAGRVEYVQDRLAKPFLIENNVYFVDIPDQEMTEPQFLNALAERTGCGILLDLHNLYANSRNHHFDPLDFIDALDLDRVGEIHIAGGSEMGGMYLDSHAGPSPEPVWELLDVVLPRAANVAGVTFEFHDSYFPVMGAEGVRAELRRARAAWDLWR